MSALSLPSYLDQLRQRLADDEAERERTRTWPDPDLADDARASILAMWDRVIARDKREIAAVEQLVRPPRVRPLTALRVFQQVER